MEDMKCNNDYCSGLMCVEVMKLIVRRSLKCNYIRLAGSMGVDVFEEVCAQGGCVPICAEVMVMKSVFPSSSPSSCEVDGRAVQHLPLRATSSQNEKKRTTPENCRVIACKRAFARLGVTWRFTTFDGHLLYKACGTGYDNHQHGTNDMNKGVFDMNSWFLAHCPRIQSLVLEGMENAVVIGDGFLMGAQSLRSIGLETLTRVTRVGNSFLSSTGLHSIDLSPLRNVSSIGSGFMAHSTSLPCIDLGVLTQLERIGSKFLCGCSSLKSISNMSSLVKVKHVGGECLDGCLSLEVADLNFMKNILQVECMFLANCKTLKTIDLGPLSLVINLRIGFLKECYGLRSPLDLAPLREATTIGDKFMMNCSGLESLDFSAMVNLEELGSFFLEGCSSLKEIHSAFY
jgi:hypothetical protein